jgi:redox-sensitive bicupin YhaK (pirin superfamily)
VTVPARKVAPRPATAPAAPASSGRLLKARTETMELDGEVGRTLFPTPSQGPWWPFAALVDCSVTGAEDPSPHPHRDEEAVNYVVQGELTHEDEPGKVTSMPAGTVAVLTTRAEQLHDIGPRGKGPSRWVALKLRLPSDAPVPRETVRFGTGVEASARSKGVAERRLVGPGTGVSSGAGLQVSDLRLGRVAKTTVRVGPGRRAVAYVLAGSGRIGGQAVAEHEGVLSEGMSSLPVEAGAELRILFASAPAMF